MKKILIIFTGGTIGSNTIAGTINTHTHTSVTLLQLFNQHYPQPHDIQFNTLQPLHILSENITPIVWEILINIIEEKLIENYAGIIVTHGTDTLAYTAAALSFYFHRIQIPLLLVSSNYPLNHPDSNGLENFIYAVDYIMQQQPAGVFVPYRNRGQSIQLHRGSRLASSLQLSADFISVAQQKFNTPSHIISHPSQALKAQFSQHVIMIKPYPSLNYQHINLTGVVAVLHDLYHSGTACVKPFLYETETVDKQYSLLDFIKTCQAKAIKVYLAPAIKSADTYQSTQLLIEQGAEIIWNTLIEAAYIKLLLAYGNFNTDAAITEFMRSNIAGEQFN